MSDDVLQWIKESIGSGEILRIVYMGGSHPGSVREIIPISLAKDGSRTWAYDVDAQGLKFPKHFLIDKICRPEEMTASQIKETINSFRPIDSIDELEIACEKICREKELTLSRNGDSLEIFEKLKRGNRLRKYPTYYIRFNDVVRIPDHEIDGAVFDEDTMLWDVPEDAVRTRITEKPWVVNGTRFKIFRNAAQKLIDSIK